MKVRLYATPIRAFLRKRIDIGGGWVPAQMIIDTVCNGSTDAAERARASQSMAHQATLGFIEQRGASAIEYRFVKDPAMGSRAKGAETRNLQASRRAATETERQRAADHRARHQPRTPCDRAEAERVEKRRKELHDLAVIARKHTASIQGAKPARNGKPSPQTVDEFLASGGHIEVLPRGQMTGK